MSAIAALIYAVLSESLAPALKAAGYRRSARTWRRVGPSSVRVVNAQGSAWNDGAEGRFTLNLALYFPALAPLVAWGRTAERPTEPDCQVRQRIGFLLPDGQDHWWRVAPGSDLPALAGELQETWEHVGAPWMDAHDDLDAARPLIAGQYVYGDAAVSLALGDRADAARRLDAMLAACTQRGRLDTLRAWGRQHGLIAVNSRGDG